MKGDISIPSLGELIQKLIPAPTSDLIWSVSQDFLAMGLKVKQVKLLEIFEAFFYSLTFTVMLEVLALNKSLGYGNFLSLLKNAKIFLESYIKSLLKFVGTLFLVQNSWYVASVNMLHLNKNYHHKCSNFFTYLN